MKQQIIKIALAVCKDKKILLARYAKNNGFYFVGGQLREGESDIACLLRKIPDEIGTTVDEDSLVCLGTFEDKADGREDTKLKIKLYTGKLDSEARPTHDVEELRWFDTTDDPSQLSQIARYKIFPWLQTHDYIT